MVEVDNNAFGGRDMFPLFSQVRFPSVEYYDTVAGPTLRFMSPGRLKPAAYYVAPNHWPLHTLSLLSELMLLSMRLNLPIYR